MTRHFNEESVEQENLVLAHLYPAAVGRHVGGHRVRLVFSRTILACPRSSADIGRGAGRKRRDGVRRFARAHSPLQRLGRQGPAEVDRAAGRCAIQVRPRGRQLPGRLFHPRADLAAHRAALGQRRPCRRGSDQPRHRSDRTPPILLSHQTRGAGAQARCHRDLRLCRQRFHPGAPWRFRDACAGRRAARAVDPGNHRAADGLAGVEQARPLRDRPGQQGHPRRKRAAGRLGGEADARADRARRPTHEAILLSEAQRGDDPRDPVARRRAGPGGARPAQGRSPDRCRMAGLGHHRLGNRHVAEYPTMPRKPTA